MYPEGQGEGGKVSGRRHSHTSTVAMQAMAQPATQSLDTVNNKNTALADMTLVAPHLALRLTTPPRRQSRNIWPNKRCCSSQASRRGELRAAAQAASKIKGVVGSTGRNMPRKPSARLSSASPRNSHCNQRGKRAEGVVAGGGLEGADMSRIVPGEQKGKA